MRDTFKWFQADDPDLFAADKTITLGSGHKHDLPEDCERLISFDCYIDSKGREIPIFQVDYKSIKTASVYHKLSTCNALNGCAMSAALHEHNPRILLVDPPITMGSTLDIRVVCSDVQSYFDDPDKEIDCDFAKYITAVVEWVMFEALAMDGLNPTTLAIANIHRENFFGLVPQLQNFFDRGMRSDSN